MAVARVTEITSSSTKSFEEAIRLGIERADKTLDNLKGAWVQEQTWERRQEERVRPGSWLSSLSKRLCHDSLHEP